ncbi:MAG: hypothetical protein ACI8QS_002057 [Planctomycetota bacterium]|jgi:hypothetical protein
MLGSVLPISVLLGGALALPASATHSLAPLPAPFVGAQGDGEPATGNNSKAYVGEPSWMRELVLPGTELVAAPGDFRSPIVIRIDSVSPHGTDLRYDLSWYGLDPGTFNLVDYLGRVDGSTTKDLPEMSVEVLSILPAGLVKPNALEVVDIPLTASYRPVLWIGGILWGGVLLWILRRDSNLKLEQQVDAPPRTLAEALRPLVQSALEGRLTGRERADLELTLIAHWRRKLEWEGLPAADALARLRAHPEAGALLLQLEDWLHRPSSPTDVDLEALLEPYRGESSDGVPSFAPKTPVGGAS